MNKPLNAHPATTTPAPRVEPPPVEPGDITEAMLLQRLDRMIAGLEASTQAQLLMAKGMQALALQVGALALESKATGEHIRAHAQAADGLIAGMLELMSQAPAGEEGEAADEDEPSLEDAGCYLSGTPIDGKH